VSLVACFDLFHSTAGILTACQLDAQACPPTDFCQWSRDQARQNAQHACAWLGACETPMGGNAFGACMFEALLNYDCTANPSHPSRGDAKRTWDCLWQTTSCADVDRCVFGADGVPSCPAGSGDFTSCGVDGGTSASVRVECTNGPAVAPHGEPCALRGQTCASLGATGQCSGGAAAPCQPECIGSRLHWCTDAGDVGIDCASNGDGRCGGYPSPAQWVTCVPSSQQDAGCVPDASASCAGDVAVSCPSGVLETVDCAALLQAPGPTCTPVTRTAPFDTSPPFDWTAPCAATQAVCTSDSCADGGVVGCVRGAQWSVDCTAQGLGPCRMTSTDIGTQTHAACAPP
jgi:hypothetical protein